MTGPSADRRSGRSDPPGFSTTPQAIVWFSRHHPDAIAVQDGATSVSFRQLAQDLGHSVRWLRAKATRPGKMVAIEHRPRRYEVLLLLLACDVLDLPMTVMAHDELRDPDPVLRDCGLLLLSRLPAAACDSTWVVLPPEFDTALRAEASQPVSLPPLGRADAQGRFLAIFRLSETAGKPRAIARHRTMLQRIIQQHAAWLTASESGQVRALCLYNFGIPAVDALAYGVLQCGGTLVFGHEDDVVALLGGTQVTHVLMLAADAERIAQSMPDDFRRPDLAVGLVGGATVSGACQLVRQRLGARVMAQYWTPETDVVAVIGDHDVGTLVAGAAVRVLDDNQNEVAFGRQGLVHVRTDTMADGYYNDPEATQAGFKDGWYCTGGHGFMPTPTTLVLIGQPDMLTPLEERLRQISGVTDAALLRMDDADSGAGLIVALEIPTGCMPTHVPAEVLAIMQDAVCTFLPLPWFPRSEAGALCRSALIEMQQRRRTSMPDAAPPQADA